MRQGYHKLLLDPEAMEIATFSTPWGNIRPKGLIFEAKHHKVCLMKLFTEPVRRKNMEKHNKTLDFRITFNPDKCQFRVEEKILWTKIHEGRIKKKAAHQNQKKIWETSFA